MPCRKLTVPLSAQRSTATTAERALRQHSERANRLSTVFLRRNVAAQFPKQRLARLLSRTLGQASLQNRNFELV